MIWKRLWKIRYSVVVITGTFFSTNEYRNLTKEKMPDFVYSLAALEKKRGFKLI